MIVFNELTEYYKNLEFINSIDYWEIESFFDFKGNDIEKFKTEIANEKLIFSLANNNGILGPRFQNTNKSGEIININLKTLLDIDYLKSRIDFSKNNILIAHYCHCIWQINNHNFYAEKTINSYLLVLNDFKEVEIFDKINLIHSIILISKKSKLLQDVCIDYVVKSLYHEKNQDKIYLLEIIANNLNYFTSELQNISSNLKIWIDSIFNTELYHFVENFINLYLKIYNKLNLDTEELYLKLAENQDKILNNIDESSFTVIVFLDKKIKYLKKTNSKIELEKCKSFYNLLQCKIEFNKIQTEFPNDISIIFNNYINKKSDLLLRFDGYQILNFFSTNQSLIVDIEEIKKGVNTSFGKSLINVFEHIYFDTNLNFKILTKEEILKRKEIDSYSMSLVIKSSAIFMVTLKKAIILGKINYIKLYKFLLNDKWYGQEFDLNISEKPNNKIAFISLITPGLHNFFMQFELNSILNKDFVNNFTLSLDSLTIKFEGALRQFIKLSGGSVTKFIENKNNSEQLLEELLDNPKLKELISKDEIELFKYTFTSQGKNLRNNIAHCFSLNKDYTLDNVLLVIFCFIRLGSFKFTTK